MDIHNVIKKHLKDNGYDGLKRQGKGETCACDFTDFAPCSEPFIYCEPAHLARTAVADGTTVDMVHGLNVEDTLFQWCETCENKRGELFPLCSTAPATTPREQALGEALESATAMLEDYNADKLTLDGFYAVMKEVTGQ